MTMTTISPCVSLYQQDRRSWLVGIIASLEEELRQIPVHRYSIERRAARQKALDGYRASLARLDAKQS